MGNDVDVEEAVVRNRLTVLEDLVAVLDRHVSSLNSVIGRQSTAMWTDIPACSGFGGAYSGRLAALQDGMVGVRAQLNHLYDSLAESAASLARVDQDIQDRLTALAERLARVPTTTQLTIPTPASASAPTTTAPSTPTAAAAAAEESW